jgi:hypothetical protein
VGNVTLTSDSQLTLKNGSVLEIQGIDRIQNIDPVAVHLKEVNHIDPLSIDSLHVSEVKNIDPIEISKFNVTNLPMVNVSLQKLPAVDFNVKSLPPVSVGTHQNFCIPSDYTLRARVLGIELIRLHLNGKTSVIPKERARREQTRNDNKSYPETAVAGNPAIPSHCESSTDGSCQPHIGAAPQQPQLQRPTITATPSHIGNVAHTASIGPGANGHSNISAGTNAAMGNAGLTFGAPRAAFQIPEQAAEHTISEHRIMSGD